MTQLLGRRLFCLLLTFVLSVYGEPTPTDCSTIFPGLNIECVAIENNGFPKTIPSTSDFVQIFHYYTQTDWTQDANKAKVMQTVADAVDHVMPIYASYADSFQVVIVVVDKVQSGYAGVAQSSQDGSSCFVRVVELAAGLPLVIAHELYHCVQFRNNPTQIKGAVDLSITQQSDWPGWWIEASAEYFADATYPDLAAKSTITEYSPTVQLYDYLQAYQAAIFLQSCSDSGMTDSEINNWVSNRLLASSLDEEITQSSDDFTIVEYFPTFASTFRSNSIKLADGTVIVSSNVNDGVEQWNLNLPADGSVYTQPYNIYPFTINVFTAVIQPGQEIKITLSTTDTSTVLQYRQATSSTWNTVYNTASLPEDCSGEAITWEFILTTTLASSHQTAGSVVFERSDSQSCNCDSSQNLPLDSCLAGSWIFDTDGLRNLIQDAFQNEGVTVTSLTISGGSTLDITLPPISTSTLLFSDLTISIAVVVDNIPITTSVEIDGSVSASIVMQTANSAFCWQSPTSQGSATIDIDGVPDVEDFSYQYGQSGTIFEYTCDTNTLTLTGTFGGKQILQLAYTRAAPQRYHLARNRR